MRAGRKKKKKAAGKLEFVSKMIEIPPSVFPDTPQIELAGNREAVIDGCRGILEYDESNVKVSIGQTYMHFSGEKLLLRCLTGDSVIIEGKIVSITFCE